MNPIDSFSQYLTVFKEFTTELDNCVSDESEFLAQEDVSQFLEDWNRHEGMTTRGAESD